MPVKIKDLNSNREDFGIRGKKKTVQITYSPQKSFNPISDTNHSLTLDEIAAAIKTMGKESECRIFSAMPKPVVAPEASLSKAPTMSSIDDHLAGSKDEEDAKKKSFTISKEEIEIVKEMTRGQNENPQSLKFRRHLITASKAHDVKTRHAPLTICQLPIIRPVNGTSKSQKALDLF